MKSEKRGAAVVGALIVGYMGIYLCRKNLAVAVPLLQDAFHASKKEVGRIASISTLFYAAGKLLLGPVVDRTGGRLGFIAALGAVALFGAAGAFVPGLGALALVYSLNRFAGAGGWPSMMNLVPTWFGPARTGTITATLSLSYVFGGVAATLLARQVVASGGGWQAVMGVPSIVLAGIIVLCVVLVRPGPLAPAEKTKKSGETLAGIGKLLASPQFLLVCALSFTLTLMRESFNTWSVDFLSEAQGGRAAVAKAALQSTTFDLAGAVSIMAMGVIWDAVGARSRRFIVSGVLAVLSAVLLILPSAAQGSAAAGAALIGAVGLLVYGPYSLLAGALAVETGGARLAGTASGIIDAVGYVAGILAGETLGRILDAGGYSLGFKCLAGLTAVASLLALALRPAAKPAV